MRASDGAVGKTQEEARLGDVKVCLRNESGKDKRKKRSQSNSETIAL